MALFLLHVVFADVVRDYWQNAAPHFAHLDYDHLAKLTSAPQTNLSGEAALIQRWKSVWLNRWTSNHSLLGKRVGDYGIGAGLLGQLLCTEYSVAHYYGIDIASRQLEATAARLDQIPKCNRTLVLQTSKMDFGAFRLDVFISQQVIQHFPSSKYLDDWLAAIQSARIPLVFLEIRYAQPARFSEWVHDKSVTSRIARDSRRDGVKYSKPARQVKFATLVSCEYLLQRIPAYRLDDQWETIKGSASDSVFHACSFILT